MTSAESICYTLINGTGNEDIATEAQIKADIEQNDVKVKAEALKKLIVQTLNGEKYAPGMAIHVIKYLLPSQDHIIKKLLLIYWEIVPKVDEEGKLRHEMILVCDAYRRDLQHPNEFIRGSTLRFLCKDSFRVFLSMTHKLWFILQDSYQIIQNCKTNKSSNNPN